MPRTQPSPRTKFVPPKVHRLALVTARFPRPDRGVDYGILVHYVLPTYYDSAGQDVWFQDSVAAASEWVYGGRTRQPPFLLRHHHLAPDRTYRVAVCQVSALGNSEGPMGADAASITLTGVGYPPADVTGFDVSVDKGDVYFTWTALAQSTNEDVMGYEIRAGATGWLSATRIAVVTPRERDWLKIPRVKATGTSFYIKAITTTGAVSDAPGTATLSAAEGTELDNSGVVGYQDVTVAAGAQTVTVTTKRRYTSQPMVAFGVKALATAAGGDPEGAAHGIIKCHASVFTQNGDNTWSFTLRISDTAEPGGVKVSVMDSGPQA